MEKLVKVFLWVLEFVATYAIEVACWALGWNVFLCMTWSNLPVMNFTQILMTVLGLKFCKFAFSKWYNPKER